MLNKRPVFVTGFTRGGTSLVMNLLLSHPDLCKPRGELHEVFHGRQGKEPRRVTAAKILRYLPVLLLERQDVFSTRRMAARQPFKRATAAWIDKVLFDEKLRATSTNINRFKAPDQLYSRAEIR
ncbi:MAG: sulfotransferase, partial [Lentisphaerae bacterium]|nr:sulfotransferase [Lentisphaerota bacterium]